MVKNNDDGDFDFENPAPGANAESADVSNVNVIWTAVLVESLFAGSAIALSFLNVFDHDQPLSEMAKSLLTSWSGGVWIVVGILSAIPLALFHWAIEKAQPAFYRPMQKLVEQFLHPMFAQSSWVELLIISLAAGFGEELLFRWCIQGGVASLLPISIGPLVVVSIAILVGSVTFGLCHFINKTYFAMATFAGIYLGIVMLMWDSWIVAAVAHAAFDFYALIKIRAIKLEPV